MSLAIRSNMQSKNIIYALKDPDTKEIRYVGKSTEGTMRAKKHSMPSHYDSPRMKHFPVYTDITEGGIKYALKSGNKVKGFSFYYKDDK